MQPSLSCLQVFLTRPEGRNGSVPSRLRGLGSTVTELPALALQALEPQTLPPPDLYDVVVFVSRYAVQRYLHLLGLRKGKVKWPSGTLAATVGASSAQGLYQAGLKPSLIVHPPADEPSQDSESLFALLQERGVRMERVLIVRGSQGRGWLAQNLAQLGVSVDFLPVYERVPARWSPGTFQILEKALQQPEQCVFLLTSSEGVQAIATRLAECGLLTRWSQAVFIVIHERIAATLQSVLMSQGNELVGRLSLCTPDDDAIVEAILAAAGPTAKP